MPDRGGDSIVMTAVRLAPLPAQTFLQTFPTGNNGFVYPSNISPPNAGCWRLTMRTGDVAASFTAYVRK